MHLASMTHYYELHPKVYVHNDIHIDWPKYFDQVVKPSVLLVRHNPKTGHCRTERKTLLAAILDAKAMSGRPKYRNYLFYINQL